jgi:hypothetical protein
MGPGLLRIVNIIALSGILVSWSSFHSDTYPYTISKPSSFTHAVLKDASGRRGDYFFPSLGSRTTNVNIFSSAPRDADNEAAHLNAIEGRHVRQSGWLQIMGHRVRLMCADFSSYWGPWRVEQVGFVSHGRFWRLTASYDLKYRRLRSVMLRMLRSFKAT